MRRTAFMPLLAACACAPVLWATPAQADEAYPPAFTGGGGTVSGGGAAELPSTGADLVTPAELGATALALGLGLLVVGRRRSAVQEKR